MNQFEKRIEELNRELTSLYDQHPAWLMGDCPYEVKVKIEILQKSLNINKAILKAIGGK